MISRPAQRAFGLARWLVRLEVGIWRSLFFWSIRRIQGLGPGVRAFPYARDVSPLLMAFIFVSALELPVAHLLVPWEPVRFVLLIVGVWGLLWMIGFLASMRVFQHLITDTSLRVRNGTRLDIELDWKDIDTVRAVRGSVPTNKVVHVEDREHSTTVRVAVLKQTRAVVELRRAATVDLPDGPTAVCAIHLYVDAPAAFVAAAQEHLAAAPHGLPAPDLKHDPSAGVGREASGFPVC